MHHGHFHCVLHGNQHRFARADAINDSSGTYHLHGRDVSALSESELARVRSKEIGFIFQSFQLLLRQDALQNVELPLIYAGMSGHERAARAQQCWSASV